MHPNTPKRTEAQALNDREIIANLYLRGKSTKEIHAVIQAQYKESISTQTIKNDIRKIKAEWAESAKTDIDKKIGKQLARLEIIQREALDAWEESKKEKLTQITERKEAWISITNEDGRKIKVPGENVKHTEKSEKKDPDPRYLFAYLEASRDYLAIIRPGGAVDPKTAQESADIVRKVLAEIDEVMDTKPAQNEGNGEGENEG